MGISKALNEIAEDLQRGAIPNEQWSIDSRCALASHIRCVSSIYEDILKAERGDCGVTIDHIVERVNILALGGING